jgi:hypothetical protein
MTLIRLEQMKNFVLTFSAQKVDDILRKLSLTFSVPGLNPDSHDPHVFGTPRSGSTSQRYGSGSFSYQAKIVRKTLIPTVL